MKPATLETPAQTDRGWAAATHVSSIFWPLLGPAVAWMIFRRQKFIAAHAISALLDELILKAILFIGGAISFAFTLINLSTYWRENGFSISWELVWPMLLKMGISWVLLVILGLVLAIRSVFQAMSAYRGQWPRRALRGRISALDEA